jgi:hypothetical protein
MENGIPSKKGNAFIGGNLGAVRKIRKNLAKMQVEITNKKEPEETAKAYKSRKRFLSKKAYKTIRQWGKEWNQESVIIAGTTL